LPNAVLSEKVGQHWLRKLWQAHTCDASSDEMLHW
jgi:hypothetical protein